MLTGLPYRPATAALPAGRTLSTMNRRWTLCSAALAILLALSAAAGPAGAAPVAPHVDPDESAALAPFATTSNGGLALDPYGNFTLLTLDGVQAVKPGTGPKWSFPIARGLSRVPDLPSFGFVLDGYGGLHYFSESGLAPSGLTTRDGPAWPGWDIARGVALLPFGAGGYVLDGYGGIHPFRRVFIGPAGALSPPPTSGTPVWLGWDIARGIALLPNGSGGYVLDGWGGLHPFGVGGHRPPRPAIGAPYWRGWDIARSVAILPDGTGGYVQDGWGGLHPFSLPGKPMPPPISGAPYVPGWDFARGLTF